ncbi:MAG TPA: MgtC/SapB family protein [Sandaracinaceae bacterium LLY-WYZ-13_1]|nr:MgtC/SapB family protein [Sandaracinaceae bacterium LLY-WYZ-13_1]
MWTRLFELFGNLEAAAIVMNLAVIAAAFVLALPVGWDREKATRAMGLRTFPLVAVASAGFVLVGRSVLGSDANGAHARIIQGLATGIGFLGGGAILKNEDRVKGTATAASIWSTAAIGAAVAYGRPDVALLLSAINFVALRVMRPFKRMVNEEEEGEVRDDRLAASEQEASTR